MRSSILTVKMINLLLYFLRNDNFHWRLLHLNLMELMLELKLKRIKNLLKKYLAHYQPYLTLNS